MRNVCEEEVEKEERLLKSKFGAEKKDSIFFRERPKLGLSLVSGVTCWMYVKIHLYKLSFRGNKKFKRIFKFFSLDIE